MYFFTCEKKNRGSGVLSCWDTGSFIRQHWSWGSFILFVEVGRRGHLFRDVFYSFSPLGEWGSFIRGGRLFGRLEYVDHSFPNSYHFRNTGR